MVEPVSAALAASSTAVAAATSPGFFAAMFAFILGWGWFALAALFVLGIIFESYSNTGWALFIAVLFVGLAYSFFSVSLIGLGIGAAVYIPIGLFWSWYRYKRHADKAIEKSKDMSIAEKERLVRTFHPKEMLGTIVQWILIWPFSIIENMIGDLIHAIESLVTKWFRGVYHTIYDSAVRSILGR